MTTLEDRAQIADLVYGMYAAMDEHRFSDIGDFLADDVTATTAGGIPVGRDAVVGQAARNHREVPALQHVVTNLLVDVTGDDAWVRANLLVAFVDGNSRPTFGMGEVYRIGARRTDAGWRMATIGITPTWQLGERPRPA